VKKIAYILTFIFTAFLATPSIVVFIDNSVDVSFAYNVNEEENSSKNQIGLEYNVEDQASNRLSIQYLQDQKELGDFYTANYPSITLDVIIPPPRLAA
jgi:hypothetical protein